MANQLETPTEIVAGDEVKFRIGPFVTTEWVTVRPDGMLQVDYIEVLHLNEVEVTDHRKPARVHTLNVAGKDEFAMTISNAKDDIWARIYNSDSEIALEINGVGTFYLNQVDATDAANSILGYYCNRM